MSVRDFFLSQPLMVVPNTIKVGALCHSLQHNRESLIDFGKVLPSTLPSLSTLPGYSMLARLFGSYVQKYIGDSTTTNKELQNDSFSLDYKPPETLELQTAFTRFKMVQLLGSSFLLLFFSEVNSPKTRKALVYLMTALNAVGLAYSIQESMRSEMSFPAFDESSDKEKLINEHQSEAAKMGKLFLNNILVLGVQIALSGASVPKK